VGVSKSKSDLQFVWLEWVSFYLLGDELAGCNTMEHACIEFDGAEKKKGSLHTESDTAK